MFKSLVEKIAQSMQNEGFHTITTEGTFDIAAKRDDELLLIKILTNIDGLNQE